MWYLWWGCRGNLNLVSLGSERVNLQEKPNRALIPDALLLLSEKQAQNLGMSFLTFIILYNNLIPISLTVTLEVRALFLFSQSFSSECFPQPALSSFDRDQPDPYVKFVAILVRLGEIGSSIQGLPALLLSRILASIRHFDSGSSLVAGHVPTHPFLEANPDPTLTQTLNLTWGRVGTWPATEQGPWFPILLRPFHLPTPLRAWEWLWLFRTVLWCVFYYSDPLSSLSLGRQVHSSYIHQLGT